MWNTICADARVSVSKTLFGLRTTAVYTPTNSVIDARTIELSPADGEHVKRILNSIPEPDSECGLSCDVIARAIGGFRPKPVANGNYMVELSVSRDGAFLAVQLLQFLHLSYEPVTGVFVFEGDNARAVGKMF